VVIFLTPHENYTAGRKTMDRKETTRREFLKILGGSSILMMLPMSEGCIDQQGYAVSLVKNTDVSYSIKKALDMIGGLDFIKSGDSVLLKLALNSPNPFPATTSPSMVAELIKLLHDRGAGKILVGDKSPSWRNTMDCMKKTGIYQAAIDEGAEPVEFEDLDMVHVLPGLAIHWPGGFSMPKLFNQVDHIIALPTLRTHLLAGFTMGLKIFVGVLPQDDRFFIHSSPDFLQGIAEIALCTDKIRLSILDARQGFSEDGPDQGTLINPNTIIASKNVVAADAVGLALLKSIGTTSDLMSTSVWDHPTIKRGVHIYSPSLSLENMDIRGEGLDTMEEIVGQLLP
jgi:uncharacterized protein (DUF362 family)